MSALERPGIDPESTSIDLPDPVSGPAAWIDHPSGFPALSRDHRLFTLRFHPGFVAWRVRGRHAVMVGGLHAPRTCRPRLMEEFLGFAAGHGLGVMAVGVRADQLDTFSASGFTVAPFGSTRSRRLAPPDPDGIRGRPTELPGELPPGTSPLRDRLRRELPSWIGTGAGRLPPAAIEEVLDPAEARRRVFVALDPAGNPRALASFVPAWGRRPGLLVERLLRSAEASPTEADRLLAEAAGRLSRTGVAWLHSVVPGGSEDGPPAGGSGSWLRWLLRWAGPRRSPDPGMLPQGRELDLIEPLHLAVDRPGPWAVLDLVRELHDR